ncbi:MAG TPA: Hpt domain-containing protein [Candidatus Thermoplasmatota archaeon]|nr:Hpt domain-containing protein [Candidatus Thermoplasmatota archaeon]
MPEPIAAHVLEKLYNDLGADEAVVRDLIATFLNEAPNLVHDIQNALAKNEALVFERAAHTLKSASATVGAMELSAVAKELEAVGHGGNLATGAPKVETLRGLLEGAREGLEHWHPA